ncbi:MAG: 30S ribosomal protein S2 [Deltaproteobacteria bacterium]|nr:30S ribosomal protein S2 [Deltaproteobacteria bacterium]
MSESDPGRATPVPQTSDVGAAANVATSDVSTVEPYVPVPITIRTLLDAGAHFGHKAEKWNPKMMPYIYGERNRIHIINLDTTIELWERARKFVLDVASRGGTVLFVGTKTQSRELVKEAAERCGSFYVNNRWLGGTLSNFETIRNSIVRMGKLEELLKSAEDKDSKIKLNKKERLNIARQLDKLAVNLRGIRSMNRIPDVIFAVDILKERIAVAEARKLRIPLVALVDTNVDPSEVAFPIPSNDDAVRTIKLFLNAVSDAVNEGRMIYQAKLVEIEAQRVKAQEKSQEYRNAKAEASAQLEKSEPEKEQSAGA